MSVCEVSSGANVPISGARVIAMPRRWFGVQRASAAAKRTLDQRIEHAKISVSAGVAADPVADHRHDISTVLQVFSHPRSCQWAAPQR